MMAWIPSTLAFPFGASLGPIAVEYRDGVVRLLQIAAGDHCAVHAAAQFAYDVDWPESAAEDIARRIRGGGFRGVSCVVGLPFEATRCDMLSMVDDDDAGLARRVEREAPLRFGIAEPQAGILRVTEARNSRVEVAAVVADRPLVEAHVVPLLDEGFLVEAAEASFVSAARACARTARRASDRTCTRALVDMHERGATALLLAGDEIAYCRSVDDPEAIPGALASCLHDGMPILAALDAGAAGELRWTGRCDPHLLAECERSCGIPLTCDDQNGTLRRVHEAIVARLGANEAGAASLWAAVMGLAFRTVARSSAREAA